MRRRAVQVSLLTCPNAFPFHSHFHLPHSAQLAIALSPTSMVETIPSRKKGERLFHSNSISSLFLISLLSFFLSVSHSRFDELFELINTLEWLEEVTLLEGSQTWIGFVLSFLLGWDFLFSGRAHLRYSVHLQLHYIATYSHRQSSEHLFVVNWNAFRRARISIRRLYTGLAFNS